MVNATEWITLRAVAPAQGTELRVEIPGMGWKGLLLQNLHASLDVFVAVHPGEAAQGRGVVVRPHPKADVYLKHYAVAREGQSLYISTSGAGVADILITLFR
jgi:hypothetical protein